MVVFKIKEIRFSTIEIANAENIFRRLCKIMGFDMVQLL